MTERQFDPQRVKKWRRTIWRALESEGYRPVEIPAGLVLAAVSEFGTSLSVLSELTGLSRDYVKKVLRRLRKERVLSGQTLRINWNSGDDYGDSVTVTLDMGVAAGVFTRNAVDPKRSAAQKKAAQTRRKVTTRRKSAPILEGAVFTPGRVKTDPLYGLPEWDKP